MGLLDPAPPPFEIAEWRRLPHLQRIKPLAQDWALNGFGTPVAVYFLYVFKVLAYAVGGFLLIEATSGWPHWSEPIVFEKAVIWTMLWEVLGLGAGSLPLTLRFSPMVGGFLYWLRPGTTRLPPWPERVPGTRGTTRTWLDVALYGALLAALLFNLLSGGTPGSAPWAGGEVARLDPLAVGVMLALLAALGLRDKVPFLAARAEIYGNLALIFLFPLTNLVIAAQLVFFCIWWGAASSKLNRHFPFVVTVMISNTPWNRSRAMKRRLYTRHPEDLLPSRLGALTAHLGTVMEFSLPLVLLLTSGGLLGTIALAGMVIFHAHILSTFPLAVPLEWNVFMIFGLLFLFGHYADVPWATIDDPLLLAILALTCVGLPVLGNFRPDLISFLPSMRYYAGNWATSQWLFRKEGSAEAKLDAGIVKSAPIVVEQLLKFYEPEMIDVLVYKGLAFRSMHSHGRALNGLSARAVEDLDAYDVRDGEIVAGVVLGYNFGDGHFHDHRLLAAVQERCRFEPGELRVVTLESQPAHVQRQHYRIWDAAEGLVEEGYVDVAEMAKRQPWLDERPFPVASA
ncbi:MAG TPA: DUF3556 domain-containing protein [Solirubrobacterales bacterium]|jgi:hypothetical protein|nr:DUF3556 domain-containing protein [Solirubrobacterales bacterium]